MNIHIMTYQILIVIGMIGGHHEGQEIRNRKGMCTANKIREMENFLHPYVPYTNSLTNVDLL